MKAGENRNRKKQLFVEKREQGDYAIRKGGSKRASAVEPTQKEDIKRADELNPKTPPKSNVSEIQPRADTINGVNLNAQNGS
jgi:hypothetical protein